MVTHFREYWLFGVFFLVVCPAQLAWAEAIRRRPGDRRVLALGGLANLAIVAVWVVSRTAGLPFGPHPGEAEDVHFQDLVATADEVGIVLLAALLVLRPGRDLPRWVLVPAWTLAGVSVLAAFAGPPHAD